jgi:hypothetical protein
VEAPGVYDPRRGRHVEVLFAGWRQDAKPSRIDDHEGRQWVVERDWTYPNSGAGKIPYGIEAERWRLVVVGPLPYRHGSGEQYVAIRTFGDGAGWYLLVDQP